MQEILKKAKELCEEKPHLKKQIDEFVEECQQDKNLDVEDALDKLYVLEYMDNLDKEKRIRIPPEVMESFEAFDEFMMNADFD